MTVSWRATASSTTVESNARRFLPLTAPVSTIKQMTGHRLHVKQIPLIMGTSLHNPMIPSHSLPGPAGAP
jgi:hypothetical protein